MKTRLSRSVIREVERATEYRALLSQEQLRDHLPDRLGIFLDNPSVRAWRGLWRAVFLATADTPRGSSLLEDGVLAAIDWGLQVASVQGGPEPFAPPPSSLPWTELVAAYSSLMHTRPYVLLTVPLPSANLSEPMELWRDMWLWPHCTNPPAEADWRASGWARSPYALLQNVLQAYPQSFEGVPDLHAAHAFLTCRMACILGESGEPEVTTNMVHQGMQELAMAVAALRLTVPATIIVPSAILILEPFTAQSHVLRWTTPAVSAPPSDQFPLDTSILPELCQWRDRFATIPWTSFPVPPFVRQEDIQPFSGFVLATIGPEEYFADTYLEYALVLWDLTYGRSSPETIVNAWSLLELLFMGKTKDIKRRASNAVGGEKGAIDELAGLRQAFGHGRLSHGTPRTLLGPEVSRARALVRKVMQAVISEISQDPGKFGDRSAISQWADDLATAP